MDLLVKMLDPDPVSRISPIEILEHPFIVGQQNQASPEASSLMMSQLEHLADTN